METFDESVSVVRRSRTLLAAAAAPAALGTALVSAGRSGVAVGAVLLWLAAGLLIHVWKRNPAPGQSPVRAQVGSRGLFIDGRLLLKASCIEGGSLVPRCGSQPLVLVRARGLARGIALAVRDRAMGRALLRALGVARTPAAARYWTSSRALADRRTLGLAVTTLAIVLAGGFVAGHYTAAAVALAVVALVAVVVGAAAPTRVTVGADGVLIEWLGSTRFISWLAVAAIEAFERGVVLALESGEWLTLGTPADTSELAASEREAMLERMNVAWRACARARPNNPAALLVRRAGGNTRVWVGAMRGVSTVWHGYRSGGVPGDRLWSVAEDPAADRTCRLGAALALAPSLDAPGKSRLLAAAASCAEPRLRIAMKTVAQASLTDDELAASLDALEADGQEDDDEECSREAR